jgi:hypothetical protein
MSGLTSEKGEHESERNDPWVVPILIGVTVAAISMYIVFELAMSTGFGDVVRAGEGTLVYLIIAVTGPLFGGAAFRATRRLLAGRRNIQPESHRQ